MGLYTLLPDGDISVTYGVGTSDVGAAFSKVNDNNDTTAIYLGNDANIRLSFGTFTIPAGEYVRQIQIVLRSYAAQAFAGPAAVYAQLQLSSVPTRDFGLIQTTISDSVYRDYAITIDAATPHGGMTQADVDGIQVQLWNPYFTGTNYNFLRTSKITLNVITSTYPTVTGVAPTGTVGRLAAPISFNLINPDGPNLAIYQAKIFTDAVVTGPGFNPNTSVTVWESGNVQTTSPSGTNISFNSGALPNQTTYWVYITTVEATGFTPVYGPAWAGNGIWYTAQFTTMAPVPYAPSVGVVGDGADTLGPKVVVTVKSQNNRMPATAFYGENGSAVAQANGTLTAQIVSPAPPFGTYSYRFNSGGGNGTLRFAYSSSYFHSCVVAPSTQYAFQCFVRAVGTPVASVQLAITWLTSAGSTISTSTSSVFSNESNSVWTLMGFAATAPATAQYAVCDVIFNGTTVGQNHLAANPSFRLYVGSGSLVDSTLPYPGAGFYGNAFDAGGSTGLDIGPSGQKPEIAGDMSGVNLVGNSTDKANRGSSSWKYQRGVTGVFWLKWPGAAENGKAFYIRPSSKFSYYGALSVSLGTGQAAQTMYLDIQFFDKNFQLVKQVVSPTATVTATAWTRFTISGAVPSSDSVYATVTLVCTTSGTVADPFYIDDLVFKRDDGVNVFSIGNSSIVPGTAAYQTDTELYVERSTDGGVTWNPVRATYAQPGTGVDQIFTGNDYEVMGGQTVSYRGYVISYQGNQPLQSSYSTPVTITVPNTSDPVLARRWWFRDPYDPNNNMAFDILEGGLQINFPEDQAQFNPISRSRKVVVAGAVKGAEFSLTLDFLSDTEYNSFMALRGKQRVLLMQRSWSLEQWYVRLGTSVTVDEENTTPVRRSVKLEAVEVDVPAIV